MLPPRHRLRSRRDFEVVYRTGRRTRGRLLTVRIGRAHDGPVRVGFVVSTKVAKAATVRNRIKRQIRHFVSDRLDELPPHRDLIIQYHGAPDVPAGALREALANALAAAVNHA